MLHTSLFAKIIFIVSTICIIEIKQGGLAVAMEELDVDDVDHSVGQPALALQPVQVHVEILVPGGQVSQVLRKIFPFSETKNYGT